jgi:hypothetical protein
VAERQHQATCLESIRSCSYIGLHERHDRHDSKDVPYPRVVVLCLAIAKLFSSIHGSCDILNPVVCLGASPALFSLYRNRSPGGFT